MLNSRFVYLRIKHLFILECREGTDVVRDKRLCLFSVPRILAHRGLNSKAISTQGTTPFFQTRRLREPLLHFVLCCSID